MTCWNIGDYSGIRLSNPNLTLRTITYMRVPLLDLTGQLAPLRAEIVQAVTEVIDSTGYILGPKVELLEREVADYCGCRYGIGVSSGTDALLAVLMGLGVGPGDLVLTTPYTFIATLGSIMRLGAKPLFVDIDPHSYNLDPELLAEVLNGDPARVRQIKAIMPVHLYGQCAGMEAIMALADRHGIPVVEDAAQAIGAAFPQRVGEGLVWQRAGSMGAAGCFSFFPSKNLGGIGDGGMIVTNDGALAEKLQVIRMHGSKIKYHHDVLGGNFRLDPVQAVVLSIKLRSLPLWHQGRRRNAERYRRLFAEFGLLDSALVIPPAAVYQELAQDSPAIDFHIYNQYVIRVERRDALREFLLAAGIGVEIYYPIPLHQQECVVAEGYRQLSFPETEKAAAGTLALPIYPELSEEMQRYVVEKIAEFYRRAALV